MSVTAHNHPFQRRCSPWLGDRIAGVMPLSAAVPELLTVHEMITSGAAVSVVWSASPAASGGLVSVAGLKPCSGLGPL